MATPMELSPLARLRPTERRRAIDRSNQSIKCKLPKLIENQSKSEALCKRSCGVLEKQGRYIKYNTIKISPKWQNDLWDTPSNAGMIVLWSSPSWES